MPITPTKDDIAYIFTKAGEIEDMLLVIDVDIGKPRIKEDLAIVSHELIALTHKICAHFQLANHPDPAIELVKTLNDDRYPAAKNLLVITIQRNSIGAIPTYALSRTFKHVQAAASLLQSLHESAEDQARRDLEEQRQKEAQYNREYSLKKLSATLPIALAVITVLSQSNCAHLVLDDNQPAASYYSGLLNTATIINIDALLRRHSHSREPRRGRASA